MFELPTDDVKLLSETFIESCVGSFECGEVDSRPTAAVKLSTVLE